MFKWIILVITIYAGIWFILAYNSEYPQISKQIDVKTMSLKQPTFITSTRNSCVWSCTNFSSSSSYWGWSSWGK
jgi:hypothetical protein